MQINSGFEMESFKWASVSNNDPNKVVSSIVEGILQSKELIGYPKIQFYIFLALKKYVYSHLLIHQDN